MVILKELKVVTHNLVEAHDNNIRNTTFMS